MTIRAAKAEYGGNALNGEELGRTERRTDRGICVRGIEITSIVQASEHAQWIALARLFLVSEARVLFPEIIAHEIDRRIRTRSEERRVGKRVGSTCRSWGSPVHK